MSSETQNPETLALHAGWRADPATGSVAVPIHQTKSYQFASTDHAENLFAPKIRWRYASSGMSKMPMR